MNGAETSGQNPASGETGGSFVWQFGTCVLDETSHQLSVAGEVQELERKPLEVLRHLLRHAGEVVTKDELQAAVWPGRVLSDTVLTKAVSRIREVLADDGQQIIKTVHGYGYRLVAPVRVQQAAHSAPRPVLGLKVGEAPPQRPQWRLEAHLSSGGSGEVWKVAHAKTGEVRVLKFALDAAALTAIKREITLYRLLNTQLVAPAPLAAILDWNIEEAPCFIESTYYPLGNLADWVAGEGGFASLAVPKRLQIFVQIADAVAQVHAVGVLHKDLKPGNVLMRAREGEPVMPLLADFGAAGVLDVDLLGKAGITRMGFTQMLGSGNLVTPLYAAPELLQGQPHTTQTDVYALGVVLYQLAAGNFSKPLAPGWEQDVADELLRTDIAAAVQGDPDRRLNSAADLASRVRNLDARTVSAAADRAQAQERSRLQAAAEAAVQENARLRARRSWMTALVAVFAVGLAATLAFAWQARAAQRKAAQTAASAEAVTGFLTDDLLGAMDVGKLQSRNVDVPQVLDYAAGKIDSRFGTDLAGRAQAWVSIMAAYRRFPAKPRQELVPLWNRHYQALMDYLRADPDAAFKLAYKVAQDQPESDYLAAHQQLVVALRDYAARSPLVSAAVRTQVRMMHASLLMQAGNWKAAAVEYAALQPDIDAQSREIMALSPWPLVTAVRDDASLQQFEAAKRGCANLQGYAREHAAELSIVNQVDILFACGAYANYAGNFSELLKLAEEGARVASPRFSEESGEMQTFQSWRGAALTGLGRYAEAAAVLDANIASRERTASGIYLAGSLLFRSWCFERMGKGALALADAERASQILLASPGNPRLISAQATTARLLADAGQAEQAEAALQRIPASLLTESPPGHRHLANVERARAAIARARGNAQQAAQHAASAKAWLSAAFGPEHVWTLEAR